MNRSFEHQSNHPLVQILKNFMNKMRQNPNVYPIRFYKKSKYSRRHY